MTVEYREYAGPADLRRMQQLVSQLWSVDATWHIGDLAWQRYQHVGREQAIVYSHDHPGRPAALTLYRSLGFRDHARCVTYRLTRG